MLKELEQIIENDTSGLLDIDKKGNYMIYGRIIDERGGAFFGFDECGIPCFGGGNLIYALIWWDRTWREVAEICDKIKARYPECECYPEKRN